MISVDEALATILGRARPLGAETVPIADAAGRVLAAPLLARLDNPAFDTSAMDGYAVHVADVAAGNALRQIGTSQAGAPFSGILGRGECLRIFTGAPLPEGADAVIMQEEAEPGTGGVRFSASPKPGQNIRRKSSDFAAGVEVLPAGTPLAPFALALAAASGGEVRATRQPRVAIVSTGDELVPPGRAPGPAQIVASNALALRSLLLPLAGPITDLGIVPDDKAALGKTLSDALETADVIVTIGGASVGERDFVRPVLLELGVDLDFWKIAMRPGKPLMFGTRTEKLVFGLPGNPVSALVTSVVLVLPALRAMLGLADPGARRFNLPLAAPIAPNGSRRHFMRGTWIAGADGTPEVSPFAQTDSAHLSSLARADVLIVQPENDPGRPAGHLVEVIKVRPD